MRDAAEDLTLPPRTVLEGTPPRPHLVARTSTLTATSSESPVAAPTLVRECPNELR